MQNRLSDYLRALSEVQDLEQKMTWVVSRVLDITDKKDVSKLIHAEAHLHEYTDELRKIIMDKILAGEPSQ